jgi:YD repeat-containing protein
VNRLIQTNNYDTTSGGYLIAQTATAYDDLGRVYQKIVYGVDPGTGTVDSALTQNIWYDPSNNVVLNQDMKDQGFVKTSYDGVNRPTAVYTACNATAQTYATAGTVAADTVVQQVVNTWDAASNLIATATSQRDHNATGTGALNGPGGAQPQARVSYVANYPDPLGRPVVTANYGTNAGMPVVPVAVAPLPSDTILVGVNGYDSAGNLATVTDPQGTVTQNAFDDAARLVQTIENAGGLNKTTAFTYAACGKIGTLTATNATTGNQVTQWIYGTTLGGSVGDSLVASNELLAGKIYPDSGEAIYAYNRLGQVTQQIAQNSTMRVFWYDLLGRLTDDLVVATGPGVDENILRISRTYEVRGLLQNITSYDRNSGGSVVNDVQLEYDDFQQLITDYQSHSGAVDTSTTPNVAYAYANGSANTVRLNTITYPNGRTLNYAYGATNSIDDLFSRVTGLGDSGTNPMVAYTKLGLDQTVIVAYPQPDVEMTYVKLSGEPNGDGGDIYTGLDRFNRVIDVRWINSSNVDINRILYTFSRASNRLTINNSVTGFDQTCSYDGLYQLGECASTAATEEFDYDPTGNWNSYINASNTQNRTHQQANEITSITGTPSATVGYDANGNTTTMPSVGDWSTGQTVIYDAWNRLVKVSSSGTAVGTYRYKWFNQADVMPTFSVKQIQAQLLGTQGHT